ncbi:hypothetical protein [Haliangium sp.]|uniref:hypothetical protein n=1 Tax=Haliangium sp. TaxID=2663208 RepID=UPI003D09A8AA
MSSDFLKERKKSLEDEFFHKQNQKNLDALREKLATQTSKDALRKASGMTDDAVLDKLVSLGIGAETVMALSLVPLIQVAWADGKIQRNERDAILQGAEKKGIDKDSNAYALLEAWLDNKPQDSLFGAWSAYIAALGGKLTRKEAEQLESQVLRFARYVAESAGGFLGIGKISDAEEEVLAQLQTTFAKVTSQAGQDSDKSDDSDDAGDTEAAADADDDADDDDER